MCAYGGESRYRSRSSCSSGKRAHLLRQLPMITVGCQPHIHFTSHICSRRWSGGENRTPQNGTNKSHQAPEIVSLFMTCLGQLLDTFVASCLAAWLQCLIFHKPRRDSNPRSKGINQLLRVSMVENKGYAPFTSRVQTECSSE